MSMNLSNILDHLRSYEDINYDLARSMPPDFYTSEEIFNLEKERLFRSQWICLGRIDQIPNRGDYFTTVLFDEPLIIIRTTVDEIKILSNVCRHRGSVIMHGSGNRESLICPYHSWTYELDGALRNAPLVNKRPDFDPENCGLPSFSTEMWGGFIYVNLDGAAAPLSDQLSGLTTMLERHHMDDMVQRYSEESVWNCNWKCLAENFMEGYHLSSVHRETLHPVTPTRLSQHFPPGDGYFGFYSGFPEDLPQRGKYHPDLLPEDKTRSVMFAIPPFHVAGVAGHKVSYLYLRPEGVDKVRVTQGIALLEEDGADPKLQAAIDLFKRTMAEDHAQLSQVALGLKSNHLGTAPLGSKDFEAGTISDFYNFLARKLLQ